MKSLLPRSLLGPLWALSSAVLVTSQSFDDWSWVKSFAAVGDSYTAGIGAGRIYSNADDSRDCSRYDQTYPVIMQRFMGQVQKFQYPACSGDTTVQIMNQIDSLESGIDLAVMTAGGNDLCLSNIIAKCVLTGAASDCAAAISHAQDAINSYLGNNLLALLQELDGKMNKGGITVVLLYAQFFDVSNPSIACPNEDWGFPAYQPAPSYERQQTFNQLVRQTNQALSNAASGGGFTNQQVVVADWDMWSYYQKGLFCEPSNNPDPTDPSNANQLFFKLNTNMLSLSSVLGPLKARGNVSEFDEAEAVEAIAAASGQNATELLERAGSAGASVTYPLPLIETRGLVAPTCPDGLIKNVVSFFLPDGVGKIFHPTILGHQVMASFALDKVRVQRAHQLHIPPPGCAQQTLQCFADHDTGHYASSSAMYAQTNNFCDAVAKNAPSNIANWQHTETYYSGTLDQADWSIQLSNGAKTFDHDQCTKAVNAILDGCDKFSTNPMNWKQGGTYTIGSYEYTIKPTRQNRIWPYLQSPKQSCSGWYKVFFDAYDLYGAGWATWDWGQQSLRPNSTSCFGLGITNWHFEYFDQPDSNGYEWHAWFNSPIWTRGRCYGNNKVQNSAGGGSSGGCSGNG